jgi:NADH-quinone oxidoreductase subunit C
MATKFTTPPLEQALPAGSFQVAASRDEIPTIVVPASALVEVARVLRDHPSLHFNVCLDVTAVDHFPRAPRFDVVYHLVATDVPLTMRVKVHLAGGSDTLPTLSGIWASTNWQEREVWDLFGIVFDGHPKLERLLMPDDWEGHPLRKDYPVQIRKETSSWQAMQLSPDEFAASIRAARERAQRDIEDAGG